MVKRQQYIYSMCSKSYFYLGPSDPTSIFPKMAASILRDQLVIGVADAGTQEKMLFEKNLDLEKAVEIIRA
jgi:hypothetical protein